MNKNLTKMENILKLVEEIQLDLVDQEGDYIEKVDDLMSAVYEGVLQAEKVIKLNR